MSLRKNVLANYVGQGWSAVMGLIFIPLYIQYLGMEAYGLIGLFAMIQAWLVLLDMGITPTLNREMARFTAGVRSPQSICDLLRSLEIICFSLAVLVALGVWSSSGYLAGDWLKVKSLSIEVVAQAISVMAVVVALRFVEGIYRGSLYGLQRQVWYNGINAILASVRHGGAIVVLAWISPTVQAFFVWQALVSVLCIAVFGAGVHRALPKPPVAPRYSTEALAGIWKFASGMMGITLLALLLTQVDKILLSRLLPLESFGYYMLAATVAGVLRMLAGPAAEAIYPRMVELSTQENQAALISLYHQGAQLIVILVAPAVMLLSFFAGGVVFMWSGNVNLAENTAPILSALVLGTFLNVLMWIPYQCQLAHGWTSLALKINLVAVVVLIPAILWIVPRYGALGAAWIWVVLNAGYILVGIHLMHGRLLPKEKWRWYFSDVFLPVSGTIGVMFFAKQFQPTNYLDRSHWLIFLLITSILAFVTSVVLANHIRVRALSILYRTVYSQFSGARIASKMKIGECSDDSKR